MKIPEALRTKKAEETFTVLIVALLFVIVPSIPFSGKIWGGVAMMVVSVVAFPVYILLFKGHCDWRRLLAGAAIAGAVCAAISVFLLSRGHVH